VYDTTLGHKIGVGIFPRSQLKVGQLAEGPCVIVEEETTIIVPSNAAATCRSDGCIEIFKRNGVGAKSALALAVGA
jgi:N-methylhydantoinase A